MSGHGHNSGLSGERLKSLIARIERVESEISALQEDRKEIYSEAKGTGFSTKIIRMIVRERKMSLEERQETEALLDLYRAAIGMLDGTPLGHAAIERLTKSKKPDTQEQKEDVSTEEMTEESESQNSEPTEKDIEDARSAGKDHAENGKPVTSNPYPAHDPRRAAFDEGWCQSSGSDGMDIPEAWRPSKKGKKKDDESSKNNEAE